MNHFRPMRCQGAMISGRHQLAAFRRLMSAQKTRVTRARAENVSNWRQRSFSFDKFGLGICLYGAMIEGNSMGLPEGEAAIIHRSAFEGAGRLLHERWRDFFNPGQGNVWYMTERFERLLADHGVHLDQLEAITG